MQKRNITQKVIWGTEICLFVVFFQLQMQAQPGQIGASVLARRNISITYNGNITSDVKSRKSVTLSARYELSQYLSNIPFFSSCSSSAPVLFPFQAYYNSYPRYQDYKTDLKNHKNIELR